MKQDQADFATKLTKNSGIASPASFHPQTQPPLLKTASKNCQLLSEGRPSLQQYWSRPEPHQFVPVKAFAAAFARTELGQRNVQSLNAPEEHSPNEGELDPLQRDQ